MDLLPAKALTPRTWQLEAEPAVLEAWSELPDWDSGDCPMVVAGPGSGKTIFGLKLAVESGGRVAWLAHRRELLSQPLENLRDFWPDVSGGIVQGSKDRADARIVFASVDTLRNEKRREAILAHGAIDLIVVDEAHRSMSPTHSAAIAGLIGPTTKLLALTATPDRMDGADLSQRWSIVYDYAIDRSIRDGVTVPPYAVHLPIEFDLDGIDPEDDESIGDALLEQGIVPATVGAMLKAHHARSLVPGDWPESKLLDANGRTSLVFTTTVKQARLTAEALTEAGIEARYLDGTTPGRKRAALVKALRDGKIQCICNAMVLTEGTDIPRASMAVVARPMRSWTLYVQSVTRSGRAFPGKTENLILDLTGATGVHNLMSAPVLIGGSACPKAPDGVHAFVPDKEPKGRCSHCGKVVACLALAGPHAYGPNNRCTGCGKVQCERSESGGHIWVPVEGLNRACIECGAEGRNPLAGLVNGPPPTELVEAEWLKVPGLHPESFALDTDGYGMLLVTGDRAADEYRMWWVREGGSKLRQLGPEVVPSSLVRVYANDIATRAKRFHGRQPATSKQREYGRMVGANIGPRATTGEAAKEISRAKAREKFIGFGLSKEVWR